MADVAGFYVIEEALYEASQPEPSIVEWIEFCDDNNPPFQGRLELNGGDFLIYRVLSGPLESHARALGWLNDYYAASLFN